MIHMAVDKLGISESESIQDIVEFPLKSSVDTNTQKIIVKVFIKIYANWNKPRNMHIKNEFRL